MRIIVAGGRDFNDYNLLKDSLDFYLSNVTNVTIVSGTANGADKLGEKYAKEKQHSLISCPANWGKYGKKAGYIRNKEMYEISDCLIAFWDGKSRGTKSMIDLCKEGCIKVRIVKY